MKSVYIVDALRTACGKANRGSLRFERPDRLGGLVIKALLEKYPQLDPKQVDDVIVGCAFPEASQGLNVARQVGVMGGLPVEVPAMTINRFCSSGLQSIALAAERIMAGGADVIFAGGVESMSLVPMGGLSVQPNPNLVEDYPEIYINMGLTAENVAAKYNISRDKQDEFAFHSHQKAIRAQENGYFSSQIVDVPVSYRSLGKAEQSFVFNVDEGPRADTSVEKLSTLKPVFKARGSVTAGNSSQMNDAASFALVMSEEKVKELGLEPIARYVGFSAAGVAPEIMGIGPVAAIPKLLKFTGIKLNEIDLIELNEAFAAQGLAVMQEVGLNPEIVNSNGGAIAMGHPLGATGAKLTTQVLYDMMRLNKRYGMVTMCVGGGMGAAGLFENLRN
ncbi:thiolase family protein [bacterium]|nr:MAG: thiolase family protein [bacterium]